MLTIAFEGKRVFNSLTGFGAYSRLAVTDLAKFYPQNRYVLFAHQSLHALSKKAIFSTPEIERIVNLDAVKIVFPPDYWKIYWKLFGISRELRLHDVDLYHGLTNQIPRSVRRVGIPKILTIHDLIYRHYPELFPGENLDAHDHQIRKACVVSDRIIAVSENTKKDLVNYFSIDPEKISVIYPVCDRRYRTKSSLGKIRRIKSKYSLPDKYLLYVGSMTRRKNLLSIVKAIELLPPADRLPLVVIGVSTAYTAEILEYVARHKLERWLVFSTGVTTEDLPTVYQGAEIFLLTSIYEGFGLPILEALASGVPVIASNVSAMPEAGGPGSRLVDPDNADEIAAGIIDILKNDTLRQDMIREGYLYSTNFDNKVTSEKILRLYQQVLCEKKH